MATYTSAASPFALHWWHCMIKWVKDTEGYPALLQWLQVHILSITNGFLNLGSSRGAYMLRNNVVACSSRRNDNSLPFFGRSSYLLNLSLKTQPCR
ncbi:hypothetical protein VN97_g266 [Penicillium thymicola]|uniref:Uncharacterized protein n=1 Tax=Penicillium thymicola TaxID=293382 RepID=A0AAI9TT46_PENTH|nr:hypothetical protein VN97_g266 [Penicillium thymicola]